MKKFLLLLVLGFFISIQGYTQPWTKYLPKKEHLTFFDYQKAFKKYWANFQKEHPDLKLFDNPEELDEVGGYSQFKRWEWYWEPRVDPKTGEFPDIDRWEIWQKYIANAKSVGGTWTSKGPANFNSYDGGSIQESGTGRLNCAAFDPNDNNHFWVGAPAGGLWETIDGGSSWTCLTDGNPILGVSDIAIPPDYNKTTNPVIYIATGDRDAGDDPSIGVLKTTDGGATWQKTGLQFEAKSNVKIGRLIINPNDKNIIWAATSLGIYKSTDAGDTWTLKQGGNFIDMELIPGSTASGQGTLIATNYGWEPKVYRSTDGGETWNVTYDAASYSGNQFRCDVAVTPANPDVVYIIMADGDNNMAFEALWRSNDGGQTWTVVYTQDNNNLYGWNANNSPSDGGQGWYDVALAVSNTDENVVYVGGVNGFISTDGGQSFTICNGWRSGLGADVVHADHHNAYFRPSDNRLFDCNDGGFYYTDDVTNGGNSTWREITDGLVNGQVYDIGVAQTQDGEIVAGLQDNGTKLLDPDVSTTAWKLVKAGDGMCCAIDPTTEQTQWGSYAYMQIDRTTNEWGSASSIRSGGNAYWAGPIEADPRNGNTIYIGTDRVERYVGTTNTDMTGSALDANYLRALDVYNDGTNLVIWTAGPDGVWKSDNTGHNYTKINGLPADMVTDIAIDADDYNHVYLCFGGYDNTVVYETTDGGQTWTDISEGLPPVPAGAIVINEQNTTKNEVYVGTDAGIWVKLGDAPWQLFNDGMPFVSITDLEIYYDNSNPNNTKIYAATYGRGVWVSDCYQPPTFDAAICNILEPQDEYCGVQDITPTVKLANIGTTPLTSATVSYSIDGGTVVSQNWSGNLAQGQTTIITFPTITLTTGHHSFKAWVSNQNGNSGDDVPDNDTLIKEYDVWDISLPYTQTFDNFTPNIGYAGTHVELQECWTNETSESNLDWSVTQGQTPSGGTGPDGDHTSGAGRYLYTEVSGISTATPVQVLSPVFDFSNLTSAQVSFWYCMNGANCGSLQIDLFYNGTWHNAINANWNGTNATSISGNQGPDWYEVVADISAAVGYNDVQVRISSTTGTAYDGDIAIDDFNITGVVACSEPTPQASNITFSNISDNSMTISWTHGGGDAELVLMKEGSPVDADPVSGNTYNANSVFGNGDQIGTGNFVVYDGTAGTVTVTGLNPSTTYYVAVYTYNSADHCYNVNEATGNATTYGPPTVTTDNVYNITDITADVDATVVNDNGASVTERGVCWNTTGNPTLSDNYTSDGSGTGAYTSHITGLSALTTYYVRAYATNAYGTSYGQEKVFTTACGTIRTYPYIQTFDSWATSNPDYNCTADGSVALDDCWENATGDDIDWDVYTGSTASGNTGPSGDHTSGNGNYLYTEASNCTNNTGAVLTPTFDFSNLIDATLTFWYHMYGADMGTMSVQVSTDGGNTWSSDLWSLSGDQGNSWQQATVDLTPYVGNASVMIRFIGTTGGGYRSDMAIDDINVNGTVCNYPNTQASNVNVSSASSTSLNVSWTRGDGDQVIVLAKEGSAVDADPADGNSYTANASFGSGSQIGTGNYVVYIGTGTSVTVTNLTAGNTYYFAVYEFTTAHNCYLRPGATGSGTPVVYQWNGSVSTDWFNANNWTPAQVPTINDAVTIPNGCPNYPVINNGITNIAYCASMTIENNASVTIEPNGYLTVNGDITNNAGTSGLIIHSDATGTGSLIQNSNNAVDATVELYLAASARQWHMLASPISNAPMSVFPSTSNLYYYDETTDDYWLGNQYGPLSTMGWTAPTESTMGVAKGYLFNYFQTTLTFSGTLNDNSATASIPISYTDHTSNGNADQSTYNYDNMDGWNLIGNPYTSAIDWTKVDAHAANLYDAIYFYDGANNTYVSYVNGTDSYDGTGTNGATQYIPAMQAFFVKGNKSLGLGGTLTIPANAKVHNSQAFWKHKDSQDNFLRLEVDANGYKDETVIRFYDQATTHFDDNMDAYKLFSMVQGVPQIYTMDDKNTEYSVNTLPLRNGEELNIPLNVININGDYTIRVKTYNFDANTKIYLVDKITGEKIPLSANRTIYGTYQQLPLPQARYTLQVYKALSPTATEQRQNYISVYPNPNGGNFYLSINKDIKDYKVEVLSLTGKTLYSKHFSGAGIQKIGVNLPAGVYLLKVEDGQNIYTQKIVIE